MDEDIIKLMDFIDKNTRFKTRGYSKSSNQINIIITRKSPIED